MEQKHHNFSPAVIHWLKIVTLLSLALLSACRMPVVVNGKGFVFGEMALVSDHATPRSADVVAIGEVKALQLTRWDLRGLILAHPEIALSMLADMAERIRRADEALARR